MVTASITVTPYLDGMVNHAMIKNETVEITTLHHQFGTWVPSKIADKEYVDVWYLHSVLSILYSVINVRILLQLMSASNVTVTYMSGKIL